MKGFEAQSGPIGALVRAAVDHPVTINVLMVGLLIVGWDTSNRIKRESFPKIDLDIVSASVVWSGHTPEEVEEAIILKIEEAVHAIEGVDLISADASSEKGTVRIELKSGFEQRVVLDNIRDAVAQIPNFPDDIDPPVVQLLTSRQEAISVVLYGAVKDQELRDLAERIKDDLSELSDVSQVSLSGLREKELVVLVHPDKLQELGITLGNVMDTLQAENLETNAGLLRTPTEDIQVTAGIRGYDARALEAISVISMPDGQNITIGDIAQVKEAPIETANRMRFDGQPAVLIQIQKTTEEDVVDVVNLSRFRGLG